MHVAVAGGRNREGPACGLWRQVGTGRARKAEQGWCRQNAGACGDQAEVRQLQGVETRGEDSGLTPGSGGGYFWAAAIEGK